MLGYGLAVLGLSISDFDSLTPPEFDFACLAYLEEQKEIARGEWNRARFMARFFLLPYAKKEIQITDIAKFDWDLVESVESVSKPNSREAFLEAVEKLK